MFTAAVQHERKPIVDKKEFSPARPSAYSPGLSRIFFRKDLTVEPPQHQPPPMTTNSDLNFSSLLTKCKTFIPYSVT